MNDSNITDLLDMGYMKLISEIMPQSKNMVIIIDDYQTRATFNTYLSNLRNQGIRIIDVMKADEKYVACKIASLVARISRKMNIEHLNNKYRLRYQYSDTQTIDVVPDAGSPSNPTQIDI